MTSAPIGLQVRTTSRRLPLKAFLNVQGRSMIGYLLESLYGTFQKDDVFVLTSDLASDDALAEELRANYKSHVKRGSLEDVRSRYVQLCSETRSEYVVRLTGDNPFVRPLAVQMAIDFASQHDLDYVSNKLGGNIPKGLDIEVIRSATLLSHASKFDSQADKEHVTPSIIRSVHDGNLRGGTITYPLPLKSNIQLSIDTPQDYLLLTEYLAEVGSRSIASALGIVDQRFQFSIVDIP